MSRRAMLCASLLVFFSETAHAADWRLIGARRLNRAESVSFIDLSTLDGRRGHVSFSALTFIGRGSRSYRWVQARITASCTCQTYRFEQIELHSRRERVGLWRPTGAAFANPQTNVFDQIRAACGLGDLSDHVADPATVALGYFSFRNQAGSRKSSAATRKS